MKCLQPIFVGGCDRSGTTLLAARIARYFNCIALPESFFFSESAKNITHYDADLASILKFISQHHRYKSWKEAGCDEPVNYVKNANSLQEAIDLIVSHYASKTARNNIDGYVNILHVMSYDIVALAKQFPNLKFINIVRDGRAVMASLMRMDWGPCDVLSGSNYWQKHVTAGLAAVEYLGHVNAITIRYEDLLTNERDTMKRLENILCLPYQRSK